jgi:MoaA/NifB/PqqE/SkfB family radical SAM enzyme
MEFSDESGSAGGSATLVLHLLGRCNLRCLHCYMDGSPTRRELLPVDLVLEAIAECQVLDFGNLYLTGGEPLLYRELDRVIEAAAQIKGLEVTLCTNAMLVKARHVALLRDARVRVNVSIDGDEAFHDHFRNLHGAFRETERGVRRLVEAGIPVTIVTTISQGNLPQLSSLAEWAAQVGAVMFRVQPLLKLGRGFEIADQRLTVAQTNRLVLELSDLANRYRT